MDSVIIFGKNTCPFTTAAREAYTAAGKGVIYHDVLSDPAKLEEMLRYSFGDRRVPVIVEQGKVTIGHHGKT